MTALPYFYPLKEKKKTLKYINVMDEDSLPRRGVKKMEFSSGDRKFRVYVVRNGGELYVLSPTCSHLGCLVAWNPVKGEFDCPCHGGRYDISGKVIGGPPPRPLTRLPHVVENGRFYIGIQA